MHIPTVFIAILLVTALSATSTTALPSSSSRSSSSSSSRSSSSSSSSASRNRSSSSSSNAAAQAAARARERNRSSSSSSSSSSLFHKNRNSWANCPSPPNTQPIGVGSASSPVTDGSGSKGWYEYDSCRHTCWFITGESSKDGSITTTLTTRYTTACPSGTFTSEDKSGDGAEDEVSSAFKSAASAGGLIKTGMLVMAIGAIFAGVF